MTSTSSSPSVQARRRSNTPGELAPRSWPRSLRPTAMASVSTAVPVAVRNVVSSAMVWSRYARLVSKSTAGRIAKCPAPESRMRANTAGASKRGKHSQSTEPARLTSAAERQSDSKAYSAIGKLLMISLLSISKSSHIVRDLDKHLNRLLVLSEVAQHLGIVLQAMDRRGEQLV